MTEQEIVDTINAKVAMSAGNKGYTYKTCLVVFMMGAILGSYVTKLFYPSTVTEVKTIPVITERINTVTDTKLAYVPGETVYLQGASNVPVTPNTPGAVATKLDGKFTFAKPEFVYMVNGKVGKFTKADDEQFVFDKNMMDLKQTSIITIHAEIPTIDLTRHNVLTLGAMYSSGKVEPGIGYTGSIGKVGAYQVVGSQSAGYIGGGFKF